MIIHTMYIQNPVNHGQIKQTITSYDFKSYTQLFCKHIPSETRAKQYIYIVNIEKQ